MSRLRRFLHIEQRRPDSQPRAAAPERPAPPPRATPRPTLTPEQRTWVREQLQKDLEGSLLTRLDDQVERLADAILDRVPPSARTGVRYGALTLAGLLLLVGILGGQRFGARVLFLIVAVALGFVFGPPSFRRPHPGDD